MNTWPKQQIQEIADGVISVIHGQGEVGVSNASFIIEGKRAFVVDSMTFPEMAVGMAQEITRRGASVDTVLNTHHHIDHMGGNKLFADAHIIAHPKSIQAAERLGLPAERYDRIMPQFRGRFAELELAIPTPFPDQFRPPRGGELLTFAPAHTVADACVWLPESSVLLSGDLCFIGVVPLAVNGFISGWIEALDALIELKPAIVVPGHGHVGTLADLIVLREYFVTLRNMGHDAVQHRLSPQDALATLDLGPVGEWIEPERHELNLERAIQEVIGEISRTDLSTMPPSTRQP